MAKGLLHRRRMMTGIDSPYTPQATAELISKYGNYWGDIKAYGYDHPENVPYINEDTDTIVSFVYMGKTRWVRNDNNSWINTLYIKNIDTHVSVIARPVQSALTGTIFSQRSTPTDSACYFAQFVNNGYIRVRHGGTHYDTIQYTLLTKYTIEIYPSTAYINGVEYSGGDTPGRVADAPVILFTLGNNGVPGSINISEISRFWTQAIDLIPFITGKTWDANFCYPQTQQPPNTSGMLDIKRGIFFHSMNAAGVFTISIAND